VEFLETVGSRRSIRWFKPWKPVGLDAIQRILEAARMTGCPGNLQPWRAVVVVQADLAPDDRERLLGAANWQRAHEQAPVWIYWFADPQAVTPEAFLHQIGVALSVGAITRTTGWSSEAAAAAIVRGEAPPQGMPPLHETVYGLPAEVGAIIAAQETVGACTVASLAAVDQGLGTCLHTPASPARASALFEILDVPGHFAPVWLQLVGYPAEDREAGGQRPREPFARLFALGRWGAEFPRDQAVVGGLETMGLIQAPAPLPGRREELDYLSRMFDYPAGEG
jgi:nitroreductase